mmetsp:Transcript_12326/g.30163  ORF Transcript_12326/g.30163 Transcript_12326/m.30163 type:complete len:208 (-) Transcript_12326:436-1059(-)|eukprot:CAMPEP_0202865020 /NCGR_PEP_ID=MMETSP1391-20130828/5107_1 /ASSEMBLY_ACC=CAM_ASM_000867 /TAXON_ID=1034604 /ORGANISM="Chlamydomonas leiostraca, Strain SAG 11-49" /LENGTH=207 /DNA_ID=CAMNT_0049544807 /DNA_START=78 /DNA_END=701 /DNA_ORIENTATION=+
MASIFGYSSVEEPKYEVLKKTDIYEVRKYPPQIRASCTIPSGMDAAMNPAFRTIAGYIFGKNTARTAPDQSQKVAMTAPVVITSSSASSQKIAMTAPVAVQAGKEAGTTTMSFIMPSQYTAIDQLPVPKDSGVQLHEVPAQTMAVIRFSWGFGEKRAKEQEAKLRAAASADGVKLSEEPGSACLMGYNPPWTLPWCRRNEVAIPVVE